MSKIKSKTTGYEYKPFEEPDETTRKRAEFQNQLDNTWNQIVNRKEFDYDLNGDALYQQHKDKYIQQGQMAMKDTIGKASQLTGGYGNSYAATAGNLAYQASMQQLNDVVPELYQLAYNQYKDKGADYYNQYGLLSSEEDKLYNREYNNWVNQENAKQNIAQDDRDYLYKVNRDSVADKQWQQQFDASEDAREVQEWLSKQNLQLNQDQFKHNKNMDFNSVELANKQYQLDLANQRMTKEEHEKVMEAYDNAQDNGGFTAQNVEGMTPAEISETLTMFKEDGDNEGLDLFLNQLVWAGMIPESAYAIYYSAYSTEEDEGNKTNKTDEFNNRWKGFIRGGN